MRSFLLGSLFSLERESGVLPKQEVAIFGEPQLLVSAQFDPARVVDQECQGCFAFFVCRGGNLENSCIYIVANE